VFDAGGHWAGRGGLINQEAFVPQALAHAVVFENPAKSKEFERVAHSRAVADRQLRAVNIAQTLLDDGFLQPRDQENPSVELGVKRVRKLSLQDGRQQPCKLTPVLLG